MPRTLEKRTSGLPQCGHRILSRPVGVGPTDEMGSVSTEPHVRVPNPVMEGYGEIGYLSRLGLLHRTGGNCARVTAQLDSTVNKHPTISEQLRSLRLRR